MELVQTMGLAFLGGLILNIMPCVLPVLTMKIFGLVEHSTASAAENRKQGLAYTGGILFSFLVFAMVIVAIKASGERVGWGMQFQNPAFVATLAGLMVLLGSNAIGVFEINVSMSVGGDHGGWMGSFVNGIVASVMATPCSAPFLGGAAAYALGAGTPAIETVIIFLVIGFGLAFPFLLVAFVPAARAIIPRPGNWMNTFKKLMGFSLFGAAVWLYGVLSEQLTAGAATMVLAGLVLVGFASWIYAILAPMTASGGRRAGAVVVASVLVAGWFTTMVDFDARASSDTAPATADSGVLTDEGAINWASFSPERVQLAAKRGRPVFMDYTADWCTNCKANEKLILETEPIQAALDELDILPMKADLTNDSDVIWEWLAKLGRSAIPAYVVYMPDGSIDLLPEVITKDMVLKSLSGAAEKHPKSAYTSMAEACAQL